MFENIKNSLKKDLPLSTKEGGFIRDGYDDNLDKLRNFRNNELEEITKLQNKYSDLSLSVYNLYNRQNPYFIFNDVSGDITTGEPIAVTTTQVSLFPILPTISWNFKY